MSSFIEAIENDAFWPWLVIAVPIFLATYLYKERSIHHTKQGAIVAASIKRKYKSVEQRVKQSEEKPIQITGIGLYPCVGMLPGEEPDFIEIGRFGIRYDHEIALMNLETNLPYRAWEFAPMAQLRSYLNKNILRIETLSPAMLTAKGLPTFLELDLDQDPSTVGGPYADFQTEIQRTRKFEGFMFNEQVQTWFKDALGVKVAAIRAGRGYNNMARFGNKLKLPDRVSDDRVRTFVSETPLHIVNEGSVRNLKELVESRYSEPLENWNVKKENYRANIYFDLPEAYIEEWLTEYRIGPLLIRSVGPGLRCKIIGFNTDTLTAMSENEPYKTLSATRALPSIGVPFGLYLQTDLLTQANDFDQTFPQHLGYSSFKDTLKKNPLTWSKLDGEQYVRINKTDTIYARLKREPSWAAAIREHHAKK